MVLKKNNSSYCKYVFKGGLSLANLYQVKIEEF